MTADRVRQALLAISEQLPQPLDPTCEILATAACNMLGTHNTDTVRRILTAEGWTSRKARLPSGRTGEVWRMPVSPPEEVADE